ncbi:nuclear transport factor 2 family protein [Actinomadura barringtoniae]|uniref:Nuclear transport factor 2 family protein n=1 Tax=Actinomadura barringtoniae TaxID=1427535 RepID=A0A939T5U2_9ACTN|nr:nuclear transport factor 2 family protein [Actinomadura barringtoniae]MBO2447502.1 nuclear transport factor 2 family protein [Actinomadura barringtoniae]
MSPREVFERLSAGISAGRWDDLADLYAEDAVVDQPFALPPAPNHLEGREVIRSHFTTAGQGPLSLRARNVRVHETADPEVIIAEFDYDAEDSSTGRSATLANLQVLRIRDGLISSTRDYHDHVGLALLMGMTPVTS